MHRLTPTSAQKPFTFPGARYPKCEAAKTGSKIDAVYFHSEHFDSALVM